MARRKHLARGGVHVRKGDVSLSNAIRRGEIVKENRGSSATVEGSHFTAEVNRELDILLQYVPRQARWSDRARNRAHAQKLDGALREVEKLTRLATVAVDQRHRTPSRTYAAELKWMRKVCALAVDARFGFHPNYDNAKHLSAQSAHVLMRGLSEKKNHWDGGWRIPNHRQSAL